MAEIVEMKTPSTDPGFEQRTQPSALKELGGPALALLMKELREAKSKTDDQKTRKGLTEALRRASEEKLSRMAAKPGKKEKPAKAAGAPKDSKADRLDDMRRKLEAKAEKLEEKQRKLAEKAERIRVREAEKAERKPVGAPKAKKAKAPDPA